MKTFGPGYCYSKLINYHQLLVILETIGRIKICAISIDSYFERTLKFAELDVDNACHHSFSS